jgi:hypothetical protein
MTATAPEEVKRMRTLKRLIPVIAMLALPAAAWAAEKTVTAACSCCPLCCW